MRATLEGFRSLGGEHKLNPERGFRTSCGIIPYRKVEQYYDGRHDNWLQTPAVTAHL